MRTLITLIKREIWEHRAGFITTPLIISGVMILVAICSMLIWGIEFQHTHALPWMMNTNFSAGISLGLFAVGSPFMIVLWLVLASYFLGCLYTDREDRSVLFWYSMPISQLQVVISKLVTGLIIVPIAVFIIMLLTQIILLLLASLELLLVGAGGLALALWQPTVLLTWLMQCWALIQQGLWFLPFLTWFMFCSAWAKRSPFLRAVVPIILVVIVEAFFFSDHQWLYHFIISAFLNAITAWTHNAHVLVSWLGHQPFFNSAWDQRKVIYLIISIVLSMILIYGTTVVRKRHLEN